MDKVLITASLLLLCTALQVQSEIEIDRNLRIVGGAVARVGQFPHAVALILHLTKSRSSFCGGSIISSRFIITVNEFANHDSPYLVSSESHFLPSENELREKAPKDKLRSMADTKKL